MFEADLQWFAEHHQELLPKYRGKFVAIVDGKVVDSAEDFAELAPRVYAKYGHHDIPMPRVTDEYPEVVSVPSAWVSSIRHPAPDNEIGRLLTAMVTPFDASGEVDYAQARRLAKALVASGSDGLVVTGTTGENPSLFHEENVRLWAEVKDAVGDSATVIAGSGTNGTGETIKLSIEAEQAGADGLLLVVPYYNKPTQEGLYRHFKAIAESTSLPCILYNVPSRTIVNMSVETTLRLAEVPNIVGVKEASADFAQIGEIIAKAPSGFLVWSGNDSDTFGIMTMGGYGVVSVASHLIGLQIKRMMDLVLAGDIAAAAEEHKRQLPLARGLFVITSPIPVKYCLNRAGFNVGSLRLPLVDADPKTAAFLDELLTHYTVDLPISVPA